MPHVYIYIYICLQLVQLLVKIAKAEIVVFTRLVCRSDLSGIPMLNPAETTDYNAGQTKVDSGNHQ